MPIDFKNIIRDFEKQKKDLPVRVGNMAKNHFRNNFKVSGFVDEDVIKWAGRKGKNKADRRNYKAAKKRAAKGGEISVKDYNKIRYNGGRAILVNTGHLKNSINVGVATFERIEIGTYGITYGVYHNEGTEKMEQRKFMGTSRKLSDDISRLVQKEISDVLGRK